MQISPIELKNKHQVLEIHHDNLPKYDELNNSKLETRVVCKRRRCMIFFANIFAFTMVIMFLSFLPILIKHIMQKLKN
jgi:hypothetical protein